MTMTENSGGYTGYARTGSNYTPGQWRSATDIAKLIRADVKAAVKAGTLPATLKYSVRSDSFAGGQAVRIGVSKPGSNRYEWAVRPKREDEGGYWYEGMTVLTDEARKVGALLRSIGEAYTRSDCDAQIDYFDVSCYISVTADGLSI